MAYDEDLADRVRDVLHAVTFDEKRMFGGLAFLVGGHLCVAASGRGGLMVRINRDQTSTLLREPGAEEFEMGGRGPMAGWLLVDAEAVRDDAVLRSWVMRSLAYVRNLPVKDA